jgi:SAM-dependent methyltransferase
MLTVKDKKRLKTHTMDINIHSWTEDYKDISKILKNKCNIKNIKNILDIGCGMSHRSILLTQEYGNKLYLIDGDSSNNDKSKTRGNKFSTVDNFKSYFHLSDIRNKVDKFNIDYELYDFNKGIDIDKNIKFDIICSFLSCGFHYPFKTYNFIYKNNSHSNTIFIFDIRDNTHPELLKNINILHKTKLKKGSRIFFTFPK